MDEIEIVPFSTKYKQRVIDLILDIQTNEFKIPISINEQSDLQDIQNCYQVKNGNFWIALYGTKVIGTIALIDLGNQQGALKKMFVNKNFRVKEFKIGQKLLNILFYWASNKNYKEIFLGTTDKFVAAQRFYQKNEFNIIDKGFLPKSFPIMDVDTKFYKCYVT